MRVCTLILLSQAILCISWNAPVAAQDTADGPTYDSHHSHLHPHPHADIIVADGFESVSHVEDLEPLLKESLNLDLLPWVNKTAPENGGLLTMSTWDNMRSHHTILMSDAVLKAMLVYNHRIYWPFSPGADKTKCPQPCDGTFELHQTRLEAAMASGQARLPNVLLFFNVGDNPYRICKAKWGPGPGICNVPVMSLLKYAGSSPDEQDHEILLPMLHQKVPPPFFFPWRLKADIAFFRGTATCWGYTHRFYGCPRKYLAYMTAHVPAANGTVDAGFAQGWHHEILEEPLDSVVDKPFPPRSKIQFLSHARYRYLLSLDGISASFRLAKLLMSNSIVLKQDSPNIEYFYRALKPGVHYIPFWNTSRDDVLPVMAALRQQYAENPEPIQQVAAEAQRFAFKYLSSKPRYLYWQVALERYKALFSDMDAYIKKLVPSLGLSA